MVITLYLACIRTYTDELGTIRPETCISWINLDFMLALTSILPLSMREPVMFDFICHLTFHLSISGKIQQAPKVGYRHKTRLADNEVSSGTNTQAKMNGTVKETLRQS